MCLSSLVSQLAPGSDFRARLLGVGRVLFLLDWADTAALRSLWCLFELYAALSSGATVEIASPPPGPDGTDVLVQMIEHDPDSLARSVSARVAAATAYRPEDDAKIRSALAAEGEGEPALGLGEGGGGGGAMQPFAQVDVTVSRALREWVKLRGRAALEERKVHVGVGDETVKRLASALAATLKLLKGEGDGDTPRPPLASVAAAATPPFLVANDGTPVRVPPPEVPAVDPAAIAEAGLWECPRCTLVNLVSEPECVACESPRRRAEGASPAAPAAAAVTSSVQPAQTDESSAGGCNKLCVRDHSADGECLVCGLEAAEHFEHVCLEGGGGRGSWLVPRPPDGCDDACAAVSHDADGPCLVCGQAWAGLHDEAHRCVLGGLRGSWRQRAQAAVSAAATPARPSAPPPPPPPPPTPTAPPPHAQPPPPSHQAPPPPPPHLAHPLAPPLPPSCLGLVRDNSGSLVGGRPGLSEGPATQAAASPTPSTAAASSSSPGGSLADGTATRLCTRGGCAGTVSIPPGILAARCPVCRTVLRR